MIAAVLFSIACTVGDGCQYYDEKRWDSPTAAELQTCAEMADAATDHALELARLGISQDKADVRSFVCQVVPMEEAPSAKPAGFVF